MKLTIDANILFSALIKKGKTREILIKSEFTFFAPAFILTELIKYKKLILKKTKGKEEDLDYLIAIFLKNINLVSDDELLPFIPAARSLIFDPKDVFYLACSLYKDTKIWSNDKGFKNQTRVKSFTTTELIEKLQDL